MNLIVIALTLLFAWVWLMRGAFSSLLHLLCVIVAGALAFAAWEHAAHALMGVGFLEGVAWGAGLALPFAVLLVLLRLAVDKAVPGNLKLPGAIDMGLAAVFGLVTGVITSGILLLTLAGSRLNPEFLGYTPVWYNADRQAGGGSIVKADSLWLPADRLVAGFYGPLSRNAFASGRPLAEWYPSLAGELYASRITAEKGRNALSPEDVSLAGRYTVGGQTPVADLLADIRDPLAQRYTDAQGNPVASGRLEGFVLQFRAGAKEQAKRGAGPVVVSNGQVRLLARLADESTATIYPVAVISQASAGDTIYGRWRFDSEKLFIASVGGASDVRMAFEFVVPQGATPMALSVRNTRLLLDGAPEPAEFPTVAARDALVTDGSILTGAKGRAAPVFDASDAVVLTEPPVRTGTGLGFVLNAQTARRGFRLDDQNKIAEGRDLYSSQEIANPPQERRLRVDQFSVAGDQAMIQLDVSVGTALSLTGPVARLTPATAALRVVDTQGNTYPAVGYIYQDREGRDVRYDPADPLTGTADMPALSTSRDDQQLTVLFVLSRGVEIDRFAIGDKLIATFDPPVGGR